MQRDDWTGRIDRPDDPPPPDSEALRQRIDAAWSRLIRADAAGGGTTPTPADAEPDRPEENPPPYPDASSLWYW